jgi:hypothetical protein
MTPATDGPCPLTNRLLPFARPVVVIATDPRRPRRWLTARTAVIALVFLGIGLRLVPLVQNRNLWIDEARLALNLLDRSPRQLLDPLDWNQGAPVGFLLCVKAVITAFGPTECALRLVPFVGSVLGLFGFAWVARRLLPSPAAVLAVGLFAVCPYLVGYAAECKQYAIDAAVAVGLLAAALRLFHGESDCSHWCILAACGAVAVWFSHPAAFVLGGIGIALLTDAVLNRNRKRLAACSMVIACWLASFGVCYLVSLSHLGGNGYLVEYWAGHFLPLPPTSVGDFAWLADHFFGFFTYPGGFGGGEVSAGGLAAVLFVVGVVSIGRERWPVAVALVVPGLLALLASAVHKYPFAGRLILFLVPPALLAVARGAWVVAVTLRPCQPLAATLFLGVLIAAPAVELGRQLRHPLHQEELAPVLAEVRARWQPEDKMYVYYDAVPAFTFYTRNNPFPSSVTLGGEHRARQTEYRDELARFADGPRVWLVFSHRHGDEEALIRAYAEGFGKCVGEVRRPGAAAYLFDMSLAR